MTLTSLWYLDEQKAPKLHRDSEWGPEGLALRGNHGNKSTFLWKESPREVDGKQAVVTEGKFPRARYQKGKSLRINSGQVGKKLCFAGNGHYHFLMVSALTDSPILACRIWFALNGGM